MGVIDFVKNAGAKVGIGKSTSDQAAEKAEHLQEVTKSFGLERHVKSMGFEVDDLDIKYDDGVATITGAVDDNATREKMILTVGNTDGVAQVDDRLRVKAHLELAAEEVNRLKAETKFYTVVSGDSLSKIAKEYYGDAMQYPAVFEANNPMLKDPDLIYPGQVLRIPPLGGEGDDAAAQAPPEPKAPTGIQ